MGIAVSKTGRLGMSKATSRTMTVGKSGFKTVPVVKAKKGASIAWSGKDAVKKPAAAHILLSGKACSDVDAPADRKSSREGVC